MVQERSPFYRNFYDLKLCKMFFFLKFLETVTSLDRFNLRAQSGRQQTGAQNQFASPINKQLET